jgi:proteasome activator subunit 4
MVPVLTSFLPPTHTHLYLPAMFKIWEGFNSGIIDDRLLEMCGELSEDHVSGTAGDAGEGGAPWKDIGIWTESQWATLVGKSLGSISKFLFFIFPPVLNLFRCSRWSNEGNLPTLSRSNHF